MWSLSLSQNILYKLNAFFHLNYALITHFGHNFCSLGCNSKTSMDFFFRLHNVMDRRFLLPVDLTTLAYFFFSFLIKLRVFTFSLKGIF